MYTMLIEKMCKFFIALVDRGNFEIRKKSKEHLCKFWKNFKLILKKNW